MPLEKARPMRERKMHFTKCALLMQDLLAAKRDLRLSREIKRLGRYDGLIIDDLGYLQQSRDDWRSCSLCWPNATNAGAS